jgi:CMP-N-acetylneuraminate monooxygenase
VLSFRPLGPFDKRIISSEQFQVSLADLKPGIHETQDIFFKIGPTGKTVEWAVSRTCDHANGRLALCDEKTRARCPLHGWTLDTDTLKYTNVNVQKKQIPFEVKKGQLHYERQTTALAVPPSYITPSDTPVKVRFLAHASVLIEIGDFKIVTDPWLIGPCFATGWWPLIPPRADALDILRTADLVYVSHNHPDHMHLETLAHLPKDTPIIVPAFTTESVVRPLRRAGFRQILPLSFNQLYVVGDTPVLLSILQAGDFRDDSGLYVGAGHFSSLLTVDCNVLNNLVLPQGVDLLLTAFASGASGFPLCFEVLEMEERLRIIKRNQATSIKEALDYVGAVKPQCYMPYAGYFTEAAPRDAFIRQHNAKNTPAEVIAAVNRKYPDIVCFDPTKTDTAVFHADKRLASDTNLPPLYTVDAPLVAGYIDRSHEEAADFDIRVIADFFLASGFQDELVVFILPTDDDFNPGNAGLRVDFQGNKPSVQVISGDDVLRQFAEAAGPTRYKLLKIRKDSLWHAVKNCMPWEDLSIGFQCRVDRKPNVYNSRFWYHFTNVYNGEVDAKSEDRIRNQVAS